MTRTTGRLYFSYNPVVCFYWIFRYLSRSILSTLCLLAFLLFQVTGITSTLSARQIENDTYDVAILGAGFAGISAAGFLLNHSNLSVVVLEASHRIGGRVQPIRFGSETQNMLTVERGANWVQGMRNSCASSSPALGNPMWRFACQYGLNGSFIPGSEQEVRGLPAILSNGSLLTNISSSRLAQRQRDIMRAYSCVLKDAQTINESIVSVEDGFRKCGWRAHDSIDAALQWKVSDSDFAAPADAVSLGLALPDLSYTLWGADDYLVVDQNQYGFSKLIREYISPFMQNKMLKIRFNSNVTRVDASNPALIYITTTDGYQVAARDVIMTFSAGVLKRDHKHLFSPSLPVIQASALQKIPMANFTKIFLQFPRVWWPNEFKCFLLPTSKHDCAGSDEVDMIAWHNLAHADALPGSNTVFAVVTGEQAGHLDRQSDEQLIALAMAKLKCHFPEEDIPDPSAFYTTRWSTDPLTRGAYSTQLVTENQNVISCAFQSLTGSSHNAASKGDGVTYQQSLVSTTSKQSTGEANATRIFFAGEAACSAYPGYTQGAFLSGILAAHDLLRLRGESTGYTPDIMEKSAQLIADAEMCRVPQCQQEKEI